MDRIHLRLHELLALTLVALAVLAFSWPSVAQAWVPPLNLSSDPDVTRMPDIAVAPDGTLHAVWTDQTTREMKYRSRPPGGSWSAATVVGTYAGITIFADGDICIAAAPDGTVHILYADDSSGNSEIYHRSKPVGGSWSGPVNISQTPGTRSEFPHVAVSPDGIVHAAWVDATPSGGGCCGETYYASLSPGGSWTPAINVSNSAANEYEIRMGVGPDNSVHIISAQEDGGPGIQNIYYYTKPAGGSFAPAKNLTGIANVGRNMGGVLKTADGTVHVVYYEGPAPHQVIYQNRPACDTSWSSPVNLSNSAGGSYNPALAADACGNLHVAWSQDIGAVRRVMHSGRLTSGEWSPPEDITGGASSGEWPHLAVAGPQGPTTGTVEAVYVDLSFGSGDEFFTENSLTNCGTVVGIQNPGPVETPSVRGEIRATPNPTTGSIRFDVRVIDSNEPIMIYNVAGRVLRVLPLPRGARDWTDVQWDGRDTAGQEVPGGVYWAKMGASGREATVFVIVR